jgi:hypothetical protein
MKAFIESLSLTSGAVVIAVLSVMVVWVLCSVVPVTPRWRWIWAVAVPFGLAYCLYWSPVWLGADVTEYSAWAFVTIAPWFLAGLVSAAAVVYTAQKWHAR